MKKFIQRFYKALTFSAICLFFVLHWALVQKNASVGDYLMLSVMVLISWTLDITNGRRR